MFIGHFAVAFAAKRAAPRVSLGTLFVACELVDVLWPVLVLLGIETVRINPGITAFTPLEFVHYPWTHSLLMCAFWAVGLGSLYWFCEGRLARPSSLQPSSCRTGFSMPSCIVPTCRWCREVKRASGLAYGIQLQRRWSSKARCSSLDCLFIFEPSPFRIERAG